jgi:GH18 family chitinase
VPEQFWNCAEVKILPGIPPVVVNPPPAPVPVISPVPVENSVGNVGTSPAIVLPSTTTQSNNNIHSSAGSHGKTIVGYYASWQWYDRNKKAAPENMDFRKVQRVNFAFFQIDTQGNMWGTDAWADPNLLFGPYNWNPGEGSKKYCSWDGPNMKACNHHNYEQGLIHLVHAAGAEIYPSIGGWTLSDAFPAMAASSQARANFAKQCVELIEEYGFDGIDIDWEVSSSYSASS